MTPIDRVRKAHVDIMRHPKWCAFSGVVAMGETTIDPAIPTACTDGRNVRYSAEFVGTLSEQELRFVVLHENAGHKAYRHLTVWRALWRDDPKLANIAADHFVNLSLVDSDDGEGWIKMPKVGIQPEPRYRGWSVQMIFDDLKANPPPQGPGSGGGGDNPDDPDGGGFDQHDVEAADQMTAEEQQAHAEEVDRALRQGEMVARQRGKGKGGGSLMIGDLLQPRRDWRSLLQEFVQETCRGGDESTWRRPNRRYLADDIYMPSTEATQMGELVIGIDTSGSCFSGTYITRFVSELAAIVERLRPSKVRVLYVDWAVHGEQVFEDGQFAVSSLQPAGGGGTDLTTAFTYIKEKRYEPAAMIVFTDGETPFGTAPGYPVLWAITSKRITAPWGRTVHIDV